MLSEYIKFRDETDINLGFQSCLMTHVAMINSIMALMIKGLIATLRIMTLTIKSLSIIV
jgi:hypothetical protein